ncbi:hypothetical protein JCM12298_28100 [Desulfothermus naphthae]
MSIENPTMIGLRCLNKRAEVRITTTNIILIKALVLMAEIPVMAENIEVLKSMEDKQIGQGNIKR